jgi:pimeloyl-ACP methyl ester carboxylesterase
LAWRFNAEVLEQEIDEVLKPVTDTPVNLPTLFIRGGKSDYIKDDEIESIRLIFSNAHFATIAGAGHWLHAEKPNEFLEKTLAFLRP